jgi:hypothetical protein
MTATNLDNNPIACCSNNMVISRGKKMNKNQEKK